MSNYLKDPSATVDYSVDWGAGYLDGETVAGSRWSVAPAGHLAVVAEGVQPTRTAATLTGGAAGCVYRVTNHVTLSDGREDSRTLTVRVEGR